jgi:hypothetical protein
MKGYLPAPNHKMPKSIMIALPEGVQFVDSGNVNWPNVDVEAGAIGDPSTPNRKWAESFAPFNRLLLDYLSPNVPMGFDLIFCPIFNAKSGRMTLSLEKNVSYDIDRLNQAQGARVYGKITSLYWSKSDENKKIFVGYNWVLCPTLQVVKVVTKGKKKDKMVLAKISMIKTPIEEDTASDGEHSENVPQKEPPANIPEEEPSEISEAAPRKRRRAAAK